jgi:ABC-type sugar transport system ATPase subunit
VIAATGLRVRAGSFSLGSLDLAVADGEYLAVVGPSGAGKSVLLEALAGLRLAAAGRIEAGDRDVTDEPPERRGIGLVGQRALLFPHLTVARNISFACDIAAGGVVRGMVAGRGGGSVHVPTAVRDVADALGVAALLARRPGSLSGGERQRVALARALAARPRALLLDEPLSALDPEAREELQAELRRVHERFAMTMIHVTHSLDEALAVARRCVVLIDGRIVQDGPIDEVIAHPASAAVARLTGARNVMAATAHALAGGGCEVTLADGLVLRAQSASRAVATSGAQGAVTVVIRSDAIVARPASASAGEGAGPGPAGAAGAAGAGGSLPAAAGEKADADAGHAASDSRLADNVVAARVVDVRPTATGRLASVDVGGLTVLVPRAYDNGFRPTPGAAVELVIPAAAVHVIPTSSADVTPMSPVDGAPPSPPARSPIVNLSR